MVSITRYLSIQKYTIIQNGTEQFFVAALFLTKLHVLSSKIGVNDNLINNFFNLIHVPTFLCIEIG